MPTDVIVKGFKYEELSDNAKARAYERLWDERWRDECVDYMISDAQALLTSLTSWELTYSIGFCQGDGVGLKGHMDATDIEDPEWAKKILPMLGAHKAIAKIGEHRVSWPLPFTDARIDFDNGGGKPFLLPSALEVTFSPRADVAPVAVLDGESYTEPVTVNRYGCSEKESEGACAIWHAMGNYFEALCDRLYRQVCDAILQGDEEGFIEDCEEMGRLFDEHGDVIHEEGP